MGLNVVNINVFYSTLTDVFFLFLPRFFCVCERFFLHFLNVFLHPWLMQRSR